MTNDTALMRDFGARYHHEIVFTQPGYVAADLVIKEPFDVSAASER